MNDRSQEICAGAMSARFWPISDGRGRVDVDVAPGLSDRLTQVRSGSKGIARYDVRPHACASIFQAAPCFANVYARVPVRATV